MSEMRSATGARNFHSEDRRGRAAFVNRFFADRLPETRPAGARIEFRLRAVKRIAARRANVSAVVVTECITAKRRQLRARSAHDVELLRRQYDQPFFVREIDFLVERNSVQLRPYVRYNNIAGMRARACGKCDANTHAQQKLDRSFHFVKVTTVSTSHYHLERGKPDHHYYSRNNLSLVLTHPLGNSGHYFFV